MRTIEPIRVAFLTVAVFGLLQLTVANSSAAITTNELIETNEKDVNDVYLATVGKDVDEFTATQTDDLFSIANQCPMVGGNAVFKARSLYSLIDAAQVFDDPLLCLPYGIIVKSLMEQHTNAVSIVPNPAADEATLVLLQQLDEPVGLIIFDAVGAAVLRHSIPGETPRFSFNTASLAPALYHYLVLGPSGIVGGGKLTIVR